MQVRTVRTVLIGLLMVGAAGAPAAYGQSDPTASLVGKWEGSVRLNDRAAEEKRTLVISSVTAQDGKWTAHGRFSSPQAGGPVTMDVDTGGQWPSLRFTLRSGAVVQLNLIKPKILSGRLELGGVVTGDRYRPMTLEKVE